MNNKFKRQKIIQFMSIYSKTYSNVGYKKRASASRKNTLTYCKGQTPDQRAILSQFVTQEQ